MSIIQFLCSASIMGMIVLIMSFKFKHTLFKDSKDSITSNIVKFVIGFIGINGLLEYFQVIEKVVSAFY